MLFLLNPIFSIYLNFFLDPNIIVTNIANEGESMRFTSKLHHQYEIDKTHILYVGNKYNLPITTIRFDQLNQKLSNIHPQCNLTPYYHSFLLQEKDPKMTCLQEQNIADIITALQKSQEKYEIVFDDYFWLNDDSFYRLLENKHIKRILQIDLEKDVQEPYPKFTEEIIYYWKHSLKI